VATLPPISVPVPPNLPLATPEYEARYQEQFNNILRLYFTRLNNLIGTLFGSLGGQYINTPYGSFYDTTTQTAAVSNTAYPITFNTTADSNGIALASTTSRITVVQSGIYNMQFSLQLHKTNASVGNIYIWGRINGVNITASASKIAVQGSAAETIAAWNLIVELQGSDYFELVWSANNTTSQILAVAASSPVPAIPSAILTMVFVSAIPP